MRIKDFELEAKTFDNLTIELEDEYMYMNFYKYQKALLQNPHRIYLYRS